MSLNQQIVHLRHKEGDFKTTRYLAVASGKGGVGKTILSLSIGKALWESNKRVLIIDADFGLSNVHLMLGITPKKNLSDFFYGDASFGDIVVRIYEGFSFISSGNGIYELAKLPKDQILNIIRRLQELAEDNYDYVIFDTPPGIHDDTLAVVSSVDIPVIVTTPEPTAVADAYALIKIVNRESGRKDFHLIVNKVESEKEGKKVYESIKLLSQRYTTAEIQHLGSIKFRKNLIRRVVEQEPFEKGFMDDVYNILSNMDLKIALKRKGFWESIVARLFKR